VRRELAIGTPRLSRVLTIDEGRVETEEIAGTRVRSRELAVTVDTALWRHDVEGWRWTMGDHGDERGFQEPRFDDGRWRRTPHLHPDYHPRSNADAWFRTTFELPAEMHAHPIVLGIGGMDDEDWGRYRVYLNGDLVDDWAGEGRWREPHRIPLPRNEGRLRPGARNLLAVHASGLARPVPADLQAEEEHFLFLGWLVDQFVAAGRPTLTVDEFEVASVRDDGELVEIGLHAAPALEATIRYELGSDGCLRKSVRIANGGTDVVRVLDVAVETLEGEFEEPTKGGRGVPVLAGDLFLGSEHPAGVNQGEAGRLRALQLPGRTLAPGESLVCAPVLIGRAGEDESVESSFRAYVTTLRPRRDHRLTAYSALGWTDFTNDADPLPHLTQDLFAENADLLAELRSKGVAFDVYMLDDWWEPTDFGIFNTEQFPAGSGPIASRIAEVGMSAGLWSATTRAVWTAHRAAGIDAAIAGGVARGTEPEPLIESSGRWNWDDEFAHLLTGEQRFCWAAEPFASSIRESLAEHVRDIDAIVLKLDCTVLHCTSSAHGHAPGKYSVHAIIDSAIAVAEAALEANPELHVVWYWGFQSPWWLRWGDLQFDKGLKLEAASPASVPAPTWRQGVSLNVDQAIRHTRLVPLRLQDSLGVWLGNVAWCNRMGKEEWRDAFLLDVARGSGLVSLWGDLALLDVADVRFLADVLAWLPKEDWLATREIGGDPWLAEPYGYLQPRGDGAFVTLHNPSFDCRTASIELPTGAVQECYPYPGLVEASHAGGLLRVDLNPWEVRCLEIRPPDTSGLAERQIRPRAKETVHLDVSSLRAEAHAAIRLPPIGRHDLVVLGARLHREGVWHYHPEPQELLQLDVRLGAGEVWYETVPTVRSRNGPGCPWVVYKIPAGPAWSGRTLEVQLRAELPVDLALEPFGLVYTAWWRERPRSFAAPAAAAPLWDSDQIT
jgi:hypothetical protein